MYPLWYSEEERRRSWPGAAATHGLTRTGGWADQRRRAALLVARVLVFEYATLLASGAACGLAQRGRILMLLDVLSLEG